MQGIASLFGARTVEGSENSSEGATFIRSFSPLEELLMGLDKSSRAAFQSTFTAKTETLQQIGVAEAFA